jgi:hypothetical protein
VNTPKPGEATLARLALAMFAAELALEKKRTKRGDTRDEERKLGLLKRQLQRACHEVLDKEQAALPGMGDTG